MTEMMTAMIMMALLVIYAVSDTYVYPCSQTVVLTAASCQELYTRGLEDNSSYVYIDVDGATGKELPFGVQCQRNGTTVYTLVRKCVFASSNNTLLSARITDAVPNLFRYLAGTA